MEIDLLPVARLEEAELAGWIDSQDRPNRRALVMLHLSLRAANLILELPACVLKSIVDGECQIGMPVICRWCPFHIHLASVWKRYGIEVIVTKKKVAGVSVQQVSHTEAAYLIDAKGDERALFIWPYTASAVSNALAATAS